VRIVIQGIETCGVIRDIAGELLRRGDQVITIADANPLFQSRYDYPLGNFATSYLSEKNRLLGSLVVLLGKYGHWALKHVDLQLREKICTQADLYIQVWTGGYGEERLLQQMKNKGVRIAALLMGSEVRHYPCFKQEFMPSNWVIPKEYNVSIEGKLKLLRRLETFADAIFSVPDQMGLAQRPYYHLQIPLDYQKIQFRFPGRIRPLILHAPTNREIKGSDQIEAALSQLSDEGVEFDYVPLQGVPHHSLLRLLEVADILVDELILHGPGWLGLEAMAAGTVVATRFLEASPSCFRPPVYAIDQFNIKKRLRTLIQSTSLRQTLATEGRAYVEANNSVQHVVESLVRKSWNLEPTDYDPKFNYRAENERERELLSSIVV
jgi:hypothetical protein